MELRYVKAFSVSVLLWGFLFFFSSLAFRGCSLFSDGGSKGSITLSLHLAEKGAAEDVSSLPADSTLLQASQGKMPPSSQAATEPPVQSGQPADKEPAAMPANAEAVANFAATSSESDLSAAARTEVSPQKDASENVTDSAFPAATEASETEGSSLSGIRPSSSGSASGKPRF